MLTRTGSGTVQPNTTVHQDTIQPQHTPTDGTGGITGGAHVPTGGTAPTGGHGALDPTGTTQLATITGKTPLERLSDKSDAIYGGLKGDLSDRLDARLASAPRSERKAMERLLHFSFMETSGTTKQERVEIRTAVAAYLAHGGGIEGAKVIRETAGEMTATARGKLIDDLAEAGDQHPSEILSENLLYSRDSNTFKTRLGTDESPTARFQRIGPALTDFPPQPERAGEMLFVDLKVGMGFDATGHLEVRNVAVSMSGPKVPDENRGLGQAELDDIRDAFDGIGDGNYSTQGVALDFMRFFREENDARGLRGEAPLGMSEAFERYRPDGAGITDAFGGRGDCMCHAEKIVAELKSRGFEATIVGHFSENLIKMTDPSGTAPTQLVTIPGQALATENVTHLDVLVPYTTTAGEERVILISPGIGTRDEAAYRDFPLSDLMSDPDMCYKKVDPNTGRIDATEVQKAQFAGRHNLQLLTTPIDGNPADKKIVGIDILGGKLWLNRAASDDYRTAHGEIRPGQEQGAISIDFRAALSDPTGATTLRTWDPTAGAYKDVPTNKLTAFLVMATAIAAEFGQPPEFVDNLLTLAENHEAYRSELIAPPLTALYDATAARNAALQAKPGDNTPELATWQMHFDAAAERIAAGDADTARRHYQVAASLVRNG